MGYRTVQLLVISVVALTQVLVAEIHRAKPSAYKSPKRASNARDQSVAVDVALDTEMPTSGEAEEAGAVNLLAEENFGTYDVWMYSIVGAILVGSSGILPLLILPIEAGPSLKHGVPAARLKLLLSFAVGSLLGDVFCHLLPEVWHDLDDHKAHTRIGLWVIGGLLFFMIVEKMMGDETEFEPLEDTCDEIDCSNPKVQQTETTQNKQSHARKGKSKQQQKKQSQTTKHNSYKQSAENSQSQNGKRNHQKQNSSQRTEKMSLNTVNGKSRSNKNISASTCSSNSSAVDKPHIKVSGYLNLFANVVDNFTHGLAVAGSFLVSKRVGLLTTGAILVHEIPHEVGDFAILLRSGFDRWKAAKAQILTATGGVFGAITALTVEQVGERTAWILAFTSGGFLYIALVTVVPDLLQERHGWESVKQILCIIFGISCMVFVTYCSG